MSQAELARRLSQHLRAEYERSQVNKMVLDRRVMTAPEMIAIEAITGYRLPQGLRPAEAPIEAPTLVHVPLLDRVAAGKLKQPLSQLPVEDLPLLAFSDLGRGDWIALTVEGDSMDLIAPEGATIILNRADQTLVSGKPYVFSDRGEMGFKVWQSEPPRWEPRSTNRSHSIKFVKSKRDAERMVVGRVKRTVLDL
ncbi:MAG: hypothetical protein EKK40_07130 [Bradyrhizobiaceae bacterium]|nr:MAG: hypothetical protein EKK40_07130 [Bradyrhizobiaceae bacterium]